MAYPKICSVENCGKFLYAKGFCKAHYNRFRAYGDPLAGGTPIGAPFRFIHEVVLNHKGPECLEWPYANTGDGYGVLRLNGKKQLATRYVCELVNGPPPTPEHEAAHSCGNGREGCIAPGHLDWKTHPENMADSVTHGTSTRGERGWHSKLTEAKVIEIRRLKGTMTNVEIARRFGITNQTVSAIHLRQYWKHI
jgi:hypothetical protein